MKFDELVRRFTGFSTPIFGVSWNPPESERSVARRVLAFLEDRRVLYNPYSIEVPDQVSRSVLQIRRFLTDEIGQMDQDLELTARLRAMRAACRKYLDDTGPGAELHASMHWPSSFGFEYYLQLGELRATFGEHIATIAVMYGLNVEGELGDLVPPSDFEGDESATEN